MKENNILKYITESREETVELGRRIGQELVPGDVICLKGDLGAGKTAFVSGVADGVGVETNGYITSPTFTIVNEYNGEIPFFHFDVYRVYDPDELYEIGFQEYFIRQGVICIEWADLIPELLPEKYIVIEISKSKEPEMDNKREITMRRVGFN